MLGSLSPFGRTLFAATLLLPSLAGHAVSRGPAAGATLAEQRLLQQANKDRLERDLPELRSDPLLARAARFHAEQMAAHADISHGFPGEPDLSKRGASMGVRFSLITENVAEAGDAGVIHDLWMHSPGHRANLLDPEVNVVGIAVVTRGNAVFAVEDFASTLEDLSLEAQESAVAGLLLTSGVTVQPESPETVKSARQTCTMSAGYAGVRQPWFIMRYTGSRLDTVPQQLRSRLATGKYREAVVGACPAQQTGAFASYSVAVLLYP